MRDTQGFWHFLFALFFACIVAAGVYALSAGGDFVPVAISTFDFVLIILATFRLTRLFAYDKITEFIRDWFSVKEEVVLDTGTITVVRRSYPRGPRRTVYDLMHCPWCIGMWFAFFVSLFYFLTPVAWFVILFLAVAGVGSLLQLLANLIGWKAEEAKQNVGERAR